MRRGRLPAAVRAACRLWRDESGQFAILTAIGLVVVFGALALAVDYAEMSRHRKEMQSALDAAALATGREMIKVSDPAKLNTYATDFFQQDLPTIAKQDVALTLILPKNGSEPVRLCGKLVYRPFLLPAVNLLLGKPDKTYEISACSIVAMRNTLEVALVLDNSGSMNTVAPGTGKARIELLKAAATQLVDMLGGEADGLKQLDKAVQIALVPFSQLVNVGPSHRPDKWIDSGGASPVHHDIFDWTSIQNGVLGPQKTVVFRNGAWYQEGTDWGNQNGTAMTRFDLFDRIQVPWNGCVEGRPYPYNVNDDPPVANKPKTLFVPMFAVTTGTTPHPALYPGGKFKYVNRYIPTLVKEEPRPRWDMRFYFDRYFLFGHGGSPNYGCQAVTPLSDITRASGKASILKGISSMKANFGTNVTEGMAWGWRVLSSGELFTEGRPDEEHGNDKVVIVLTDGANLYGPETPSAYGMVEAPHPPGGIPRLFAGTTLDPNDLSDANTTAAMNQHFAQLCQNAKAPRTSDDKRPNLTVMTVALDLDSRVAVEKDQIKLLEDCASNSRIDPKRKLFWNATGATLGATFKDIADELSNLRVVQ